jgi:general secretion pathway protein D
MINTNFPLRQGANEASKISKTNQVFAFSKILLILFFLIIVSGLGVTQDIGVSGTSADTELVSMDFDNVDLRVIIKYMSELTGKNFIINSGVKGTATVMSPTKIPLDEAYKVLESILIVNGYTTVPSDNMIKVIPISDAKQLDIETHVGKQVNDEKLKDRVITQIIPLEYADVEKIRTILLPYVSVSGHIAGYDPTNTLIITDISSNLSKLLEMIRDLDKTSGLEPDNVHVYKIQNTDANNLAQILTKVYVEKKQQSKEDVISQAPTIVADVATNSLVVLCSQQEYSFVEQLIKKLDSRKPQVLVEAVIAEVSMDKTKEFGLDVVAAGGIVYGSSSGLAGAEAKGVVRNILTGGGFQDTNALGVVEGTKMIPANDINGQTTNIVMPNLGILITASKNSDDVNVLSAPQLLATDNQESQILVGKQLAFIKNSQVTAEGGTVKTFEYKDVGIMLKFTPHISEDGYVRMDITQQVDDVIGQTFEGAVETSKREASTQVTVKDDTTVVIGGLLTDKTKDRVEKVPVLGDIPIVNLLFKRTKTESEKMNLFIFITPHIVKDENELAELTAQRKSLVELDDQVIKGNKKTVIVNTEAKETDKTFVVKDNNQKSDVVKSNIKKREKVNN